MAYIVGVVLLILTFGMVLKYGFGNSHVVEIVGPFHGILYVFYLITVIDLGLKAKFSVVKMILVMLAGTIPFVSFIAEHQVAKQLGPVVAAGQSSN